MQQIERYGVIALVFLLVTIVAVSFWGDSKSPGFWSRLTGKSDGKKEQTDAAVASNALVVDHVADTSLPLSAAPAPAALPPANDVVLANGNSPAIADMPIAGNATIPAGVPGAAPAGGPVRANPFLPLAGSAPVVPVPIPAAVPATLPGATSEYVVQKGDSLALIARRKLGAESRWTQIQAANPGLDPKRLAPGMKLQLPAVDASVAIVPASSISAPKPAPKTAGKAATSAKKPAAAAAPKVSASTYTVKKGDHLRAIARSQLGDENRWKDIVAANPGLDPSKLAIGQHLKLPQGGSVHREPSAPIVALADKPRVK